MRIYFSFSFFKLWFLIVFFEIFFFNFLVSFAGSESVFWFRNLELRSWKLGFMAESKRYVPNQPLGMISFPSYSHFCMRSWGSEIWYFKCDFRLKNGKWFKDMNLCFLDGFCLILVLCECHALIFVSVCVMAECYSVWFPACMHAC